MSASAPAHKAALSLLLSAIVIATMLRTDRQGARAEGRVLTIFHADSLTGYTMTLAREFQASHPGSEVHRQASGSLDAIRRVTDLHLPCDVLITADWRLLNTPLAGVEPWLLIFAGNSLGLLYTEKSAAAGEINANNWYQILTRAGVRWGHSNPERDPAGYWSLIVWQLAERYYKQPGLAARLAAACPPANIRPKAIDFIPLLESGDIDYYFGYSSDSRLGGVKFLELPREINLGDPAHASDYGSVSVEIGSGAHQRRVAGAPIAYGATLTSDPPNRRAAIEFLELMLGGSGRAAAVQSGLVAYPQALSVDAGGAMPLPLKALTRPFNP